MKSARALLASLLLLALTVTVATVGAQDAGTTPAAAPADTATAKPASATPAVAKPASAAESVDARAAELSAVERELALVMDELVQARARAAVIARGLFQTELSVELVRRADAQRLSHLSLALDGVPVHDSDGSALLSSDRAALFRGYVAPGMHELTVELAETAKESARYGYTRTERYRIDVKKDKRTRVELVLRDDSDMAEQAAEGDEGAYQLASTVRVSYERAARQARD
jgi:hypothetical protein